MLPCASEDTLHLKEVSGNMFGGNPSSRKIFRMPEDEALLLQKRNFLRGNPADLKLFNEKNNKKHEKSLSPCVWINKKCFLMVTTMLYTPLDSSGLREHHANLSGVNLMPLAGDNGI